jgi:hypothetical protein
MSLRDYFAASATEIDIELARRFVPKVNRTVPSYSGREVNVLPMLPDDWRQLARYIHADMMLAARAKGEAS